MPHTKIPAISTTARINKQKTQNEKRKSLKGTTQKDKIHPTAYHGSEKKRILSFVPDLWVRNFVLVERKFKAFIYTFFVGSFSYFFGENGKRQKKNVRGRKEKTLRGNFRRFFLSQGKKKTETYLCGGVWSFEAPSSYTRIV